MARRGTYEWNLVVDDVWVECVHSDGRRRVVAPHAAAEHHREVNVRNTDAPIGAVGELRYVSNFPEWGRLEFEWTKGYRIGASLRGEHG